MLLGIFKNWHILKIPKAQWIQYVNNGNNLLKVYLINIINAGLKTIPTLPVKLDKRHVLEVCCSIPQTQNKREMGPHSATELKADSAFLQRIRQRVALQVPELGVIPCVPGQKSNWQLGEQENKNNIRTRIKVANYTLTEQSNGLFICGLFLFLENGDSRVSQRQHK